MIFEHVPQIVYITDGKGNIIKGMVVNCTLSNEWHGEASMQVECKDITFMKNPSIGDIDVDVFQAMLEDGYGRHTEVSEEVTEETSEES